MKRPHMWRAEVVAEGQRVMAVCNACRYCEGYCPVFPAMEDRVTFLEADLAYLANLCHNCGECLYACQYAPPHQFRINVPRTMAEIRLASYEAYCWPRFLGGAFRRQPLVTMVAVTAGLAAVLALAGPLSDPTGTGDVYRVLPHRVMVTLFSAETLLVAAALAAAWNKGRQGFGRPALFQALRDALTLKYLHGAGDDCTDGEDTRGPWRRWFHHCTFYGFALCLASTSVAAIYHTLFGWRAPYPYTSLPVALGTAGGVGLLVGPAGLLVRRRQGDAALRDPTQRGLELSFLTLLWSTSATGLLLLALRETRAMPALLVIHLASVFAWFLVLPYGKFVHGLHRLAALATFAGETRGRA